MTRSKPKVLISRCLTFEACRYDGGIIQNEYIEKLKGFINFTTICPEVEIGLGVPRDWLSLVMHENQPILYQRATKKDYTYEVDTYAETLFNKHPDVDGFILKGRSPSCGIKNVKLYPSKDNKIHSGKTAGVFGQNVLDHFTNYPIETEGRLRNFKIRETFLTKLFTVHRFRSVLNSQKMKDLVAFHANHKFLFQSFNENGMRTLGKICANHEHYSPKKVIQLYHQHMFNIFEKERKFTKNINVLEHCFGFISNQLSTSEKEYFFDILEQYREAKLPLSVPLHVVRSWAIKYQNDYLLTQHFFNPYPVALMDIKDSGKGRSQ